MYIRKRINDRVSRKSFLNSIDNVLEVKHAFSTIFLHIKWILILILKYYTQLCYMVSALFQLLSEWVVDFPMPEFLDSSLSESYQHLHNYYSIVTNLLDDTTTNSSYESVFMCYKRREKNNGIWVSLILKVVNKYLNHVIIIVQLESKKVIVAFIQQNCVLTFYPLWERINNSKWDIKSNYLKIHLNFPINKC